jgi:hypothetical protein
MTKQLVTFIVTVVYSSYESEVHSGIIKMSLIFTISSSIYKTVICIHLFERKMYFQEKNLN